MKFWIELACGLIPAVSKRPIGGYSSVRLRLCWGVAMGQGIQNTSSPRASFLMSPFFFDEAPQVQVFNTIRYFKWPAEWKYSAAKFFQRDIFLCPPGVKMTAEVCIEGSLLEEISWEEFTDGDQDYRQVVTCDCG